MIGETKTAARRTDLPEHGGKRDQHPVLLLAKLLALHPQPDINIVVLSWNNAASSRILSAETPQIPAAHSAVLATVGLPREIVGKLVKAGGAAGEEVTVVPVVLHQRMGDTQHHCHVGAHMRRNPLGAVAEEIQGFRAHRVNADDALAAFAQRVEIANALLVTGIPGNFQRVKRVGTQSTTTSVCASTSGQLVCCW